MSNGFVEITRHAFLNTELPFDGGLEAPAVGVQPLRHGFAVEGWVSLRADSRRPARIHLRHHRTTLLTMPAVPRSGGPEFDFSARFSALGLDAEFSIDIVVELDDGNTEVCAQIEGKRTPLSAPANPVSPQPVLITTLGRSGSTRLAHLLSEHPDIAYFRPFERETRSFQHWAAALLNLTNPAVYGQQIRLGNSQVVTSPDLQAETPFPATDDADEVLAEGFDQFQVPALAQTLRDHWIQVAGQMRDAAKPGASAFVEKNSRTACSLLAHEWLPGTKELMLVRDFRDVACSWRAFALKNGMVVGNEEVDESDISRMGFVHEAGERLRGLHQGRPEHIHLVRYEDLIEKPIITIEAAFDFLGLPLSDSAMAALLERCDSQHASRQSVHRTSQSVAASIGRWRSEFDAREITIAHDFLGDILEYFGYPT